MIAWSIISWSLAGCGTAAALGFAALCAWWFLAPDVFTQTRQDAPTFRMLSNQMIPETTFRAGDTMYVLREWCISRLAEYDYSRKFIDGFEYVLPEPSRVAHEPGCYRHHLAVEIPAKMPPGVYRYRVQLIYRLSPWRRQVVNLPAPTIQVDP